MALGGCFDLRQNSELATKNISSNLTDSEKADLSAAYSTDEPDFSTAIEEVAWFKFFWKVNRGRGLRKKEKEDLVAILEPGSYYDMTKVTFLGYETRHFYIQLYNAMFNPNPRSIHSPVTGLSSWEWKESALFFLF